jgi:hypothetical protein
LHSPQNFALPVNCARAFDADIFCAVGDDQRVAERNPVARRERINIAVIGGVGAAEQDGLRIEVQRPIFNNTDSLKTRATDGTRF